MAISPRVRARNALHEFIFRVNETAERMCASSSATMAWPRRGNCNAMRNYYDKISRTRASLRNPHSESAFLHSCRPPLHRTLRCQTLFASIFRNSAESTVGFAQFALLPYGHMVLRRPFRHQLNAKMCMRNDSPLLFIEYTLSWKSARQGSGSAKHTRRQAESINRCRGRGRRRRQRW